MTEGVGPVFARIETHPLQPATKPPDEFRLFDGNETSGGRGDQEHWTLRFDVFRAVHLGQVGERFDWAEPGIRRSV